MGLPTFYLQSEDVLQWGYGRKQLRGRSTVLHRDSIKDTELTTFKDRAKAFLDDLGLPVPHGDIVFDADEARRAAARLGFPVVTKPVAGHKGQGVTTGIASERDLELGFKLAVEASATADDGVIVEQQIVGHRPSPADRQGQVRRGPAESPGLRRRRRRALGGGAHRRRERAAGARRHAALAHGEDRRGRQPGAVRARPGPLPVRRARPRGGAGAAPRGEHLGGWRVGERDRRHPPAQRQARRGRRQVPRRARPRHRPAGRRHHEAVDGESLRHHRDQRRPGRVHASRTGPGRRYRRALHRAAGPLPDAAVGARARARLQPSRRRDGDALPRARPPLPRRRRGRRRPPRGPRLQRRVLRVGGRCTSTTSAT